MIVAAAALLATAVAAVFAAQLVGQFRFTRAPHTLAWAVSLGLFAVASLAVLAGVAWEWNTAVFAVYWFAGALVTVPFLAAGQVMLLDPPRSVLYATLAGLTAVWAAAALAMGDMDAGLLAAATRTGSLPLGREVLGEGELAYRLLRPYTYTFVIVVVGSIWSAVRSRRWGLLLIALGVTIAGISHLVAAGRAAVFALSLAVGVTVMYAGFRAAAKPSRRNAGAAGAAGAAASRQTPADSQADSQSKSQANSLGD